MNSTLESARSFFGAAQSRNRFWAWGIRSGLSVLDQGLISGAGFLLNLFLARWLTAEVYGAFAVAFASFLFLAGFHSVLLMEPMSVFGPSRYSENVIAYFAGQLKVHAVLAGAISLVALLLATVMAVAGATPQLAAATAGSALAMPFLLLFWLVRRMCYVVHRPSIAVSGSAGYLLLMLVGLAALRAAHLLGVFSAFLLAGGVSIPASLVLLWQLGALRSQVSTTYSWRHVLRENWAYGRWLVASTALFSVVSQTQTYFAAVFLGLGAAGILRAVQIPSLVMTQIIIAAGLLVLPSMARDYGLARVDQLRKKAVVTSVFLTAMALAYAALLAVFAQPIERVVFGGKFAVNAWLIPVLGLVPVCLGFGEGFMMAVRAFQKPHYDLIANAISAPVVLITAALFIRAWGLGGAAVSLVTGFAVYAAVFFRLFVKSSTVHEQCGRA